MYLSAFKCTLSHQISKDVRLCQYMSCRKFTDKKNWINKTNSLQIVDSSIKSAGKTTLISRNEQLLLQISNIKQKDDLSSHFIIFDLNPPNNHPTPSTTPKDYASKDSNGTHRQVDQESWMEKLRKRNR
jgi:hypothetical protein